jgi:GABA(A) receptor-associated protein
MSEFVEQFHKNISLKDRKQQAAKIRSKYPDRLPVIVDRTKTRDPKLDKHKFLVPAQLTLAQFTHVVRQRFLGSSGSSNSTLGLSWHVNQTMPPLSELIANLEPNEDGFIVLLYSAENVFG